jgi:serine/threonine protein kinase
MTVPDTYLEIPRVGIAVTHRVAVYVNGCAPREVDLGPGQRLVLGRGTDADLRLDDRLASRRHACVEVTANGEVRITDLDSRNGTFLGATRLAPQRPTAIPLGKIARMGEHTLTVEAHDDGGPAGLLREAPPLGEGEFEFLGEIGCGGVGRVWAARQLLLDRMVAVKELRPELRLGPDLHKRFLREARLYCRVKSPYVVELYDMRVVGGRPYLIMELVGGSTARDRVKLKGGRLPVPEALKIAQDVAHALVAISEQGIVHRDVKPQNILLGPRRAKLADFGIAKAQDASSLTGDSVRGLGTLPFAAPEQLGSAGAPVDARTDLYGLGATLYALISGRAPFPTRRGEQDLLRTLERIHTQPPRPLRDLVPECPAAVDLFVRRLLAKEPSRRPRDAVQVVGRLEALREDLFPEWRPDLEDSEGVQLPLD